MSIYTRFGLFIIAVIAYLLIGAIVTLRVADSASEEGQAIVMFGWPLAVAIYVTDYILSLSKKTINR